MNGEPHDRESRRVEDVVDLSPKAIDSQVTERPVEPASSGESLRNPPAFQQDQRLQDAEARVEELQAAAEVSQAEADAAIETAGGPVNIGLAAAITVGLPDMVQRFDVNGDEILDQRERDRAIRSVQSEYTFDQVRGGSPHSPDAEVSESGAGEGAEAYAELQARRAESAKWRAEGSEKRAQQAEAAVELIQGDAEAQGQGVAAGGRFAGSDEAYAKSEELGVFPGAARSVSA